MLPGRRDPGRRRRGPDGTPDEADVRGDRARTLLGGLTDALEHGSAADVRALAAPGDRAAARELETLRANVRSLRITDLSMRYVDEDGGRVADQQQRSVRRPGLGRRRAARLAGAGLRPGRERARGGR